MIDGFYPDDGTVLAEELLLPQDANALPFRLPFGTTDGVVQPVFLIERLTVWIEGGIVPTFSGAFAVEAFAQEVSLGTTSAGRFRVSETEVIDLSPTYSLARCKVMFPVPDVAGDQWQFLHLRVKLITRSYVDVGAGPVLAAEAVGASHVWRANPVSDTAYGYDPLTYDAADITTWPSFGLLTPDQPSAPTPPPDPAPDAIGTGTSAYTETLLRFVWPRSDCFWLTGNGGRTWAQGGIPGSYAHLRRFRGVRLTKGVLALP